MATKTKLEMAIERRVESLNEAQKELVRVQYATYKHNRDRMARIQDRMLAIDAGTYRTIDEMRASQVEKSSLAYEYSQLATANSRISADLHCVLGDEEGK